jgi:hypothetical protein
MAQRVTGHFKPQTPSPKASAYGAQSLNHTDDPGSPDPAAPARPAAPAKPAARKRAKPRSAKSGKIRPRLSAKTACRAPPFFDARRKAGQAPPGSAGRGPGRRDDPLGGMSAAHSWAGELQHVHRDCPAISVAADQVRVASADVMNSKRVRPLPIDNRVVSGGALCLRHTCHYTPPMTKRKAPPPLKSGAPLAGACPPCNSD